MKTLCKYAVSAFNLFVYYMYTFQYIIAIKRLNIYINNNPPMSIPIHIYTSMNAY